MRLALRDLKMSSSRSSASLVSVTFADHLRPGRCLAIVSPPLTRENYHRGTTFRSEMANQHHSTKCGRATAGFTPRPGFDYFNHDQIIATTVVAIVAVASQPMICSAGVRVNPAMTVRRIVINIIVTINGTATTPFRTALQ
jgi:hypothetical protein